MISVVIRCSDDFRVLHCIDSIKETAPQAQIIVSMTANKNLKKAVESKGVNFCIVPKHNAAITNIRGLALTRNEKVIVTDADTQFEKNTINLIEKALDKHDVVKPRLVFRSKKNNPFSKAIASLRTFFNDREEKMYIPGVSFKKEINNKIGGYIFDKDIPWGEDAEFSRRVIRNKLKTKVIKDGILYHPSVDPMHDLADAFLIGFNKYSKEETIQKVISKRFSFHKKVYMSYGLSTLAYSLLWYFFFDLGKIFQQLGVSKETVENNFWKLISKDNNT